MNSSSGALGALGGASPAGVLADFDPPAWLRGPHVQSVLASLHPRRYWVERRARALLAAGQSVVVDCGDGVRLSGSYSANDAGAGLVVLIHGWEGSIDSSYVLSAGAHLYERGYAVFRLNLRDHGDSFHLNEGNFHSCRLAEVAGAVRAIRASYRPGWFGLAGFSLGGNFALRVAAAAPDAGLDRIVAICPVLDPARTMTALDSGASIYQRYFIRKWSASLHRKSELWPGLYDFSGLKHHPNLERMTDFLVRAYTEYPTLATYLEGYAITGSRLSSLSVPSSILASLDDPIIPAEDLDRLARAASLEITVTNRGGHCGYVESLAGPSFADRFLAQKLAAR